MSPKTINRISTIIVSIIVMTAVIVILKTHGDGSTLCEKTITDSCKTVSFNNDKNSMNVCIVIIDGNEYYVTRTAYGYWVPFPKIPPKTGNETQSQ